MDVDPLFCPSPLISANHGNFERSFLSSGKHRTPCMRDRGEEEEVVVLREICTRALFLPLPFSFSSLRSRDQYSSSCTLSFSFFLAVVDDQRGLEKGGV